MSAAQQEDSTPVGQADAHNRMTKRLNRPSEMVKALSSALTLRYLSLAREAAWPVNELQGRAAPEIAGVLSFSELRTQYVDILGEWLSETPRNERECLALAQFASAIIADRRVYSALGSGSIVGEEDDDRDAVKALEQVQRWLSNLDITRCAAEIRGSDSSE